MPRVQHLLRKTRVVLTALLAKIQAHNPTVFPAWEVLRMATIEGARADLHGDVQADLHVSMQAGDEVGSPESGKQDGQFSG